MKLTNLQKELILEMKNQGAEKTLVNWAMRNLQTQQQQEQMMKYLTQIKNQNIPKGIVITKIQEIIEN